MARTPETIAGRFSNPLVLNLIEITAPGDPLIWRLSQNSVPWFFGTVNPSSITGFLNNDFYMNVTTGAIWQLQSGLWINIPSGGSNGGAYAATFSNQTSLVITGVTHALGTADLIVAIYDSATGTRNLIIPNSVSIDSTTYDVTVTFEAAQSGRIVIQG
jgi:hypothetical protein